MNVPATMCALQQTSLNGPEDMRLITDAPVPVPGQNEVLIRVTAAGVNFADISKAHGTFLGGPRPPYLAGFEAAGEVVAVGDAVAAIGPQPGDRVVGVGDGAFAEFMVLPATGAMPLPPSWTEEQALGLLVNWPTALAALKPLGGITGGQTVLVHAAAGATGQAAVVMAKHYGATVIATASPGKHETVLALGADHVLDSLGGDVAAEVLRLTGGAGVDIVLESAGRRHLRRKPRCSQTGHRPSRRLRYRGRRSFDHQLGSGVQAPGPRDRLQHRRSDPGRSGNFRRGHGRAVRAPCQRRVDP